MIILIRPEKPYILNNVKFTHTRVSISRKYPILIVYSLCRERERDRERTNGALAYF